MDVDLYFEDVPEELVEGLRALGEEYPVASGPRTGATRIRFEHAEGEGTLEVKTDGDGIIVSYTTPSAAFRALGGLLSQEDFSPFREKVPCRTFGVMLDCSRNAVPRVGQLKKWMRRLALMGYNMMMLYMEDTYEVPGEPFFGYLRGRYSEEELREVDDYAYNLGIEAMPCIQTLGHLGQVLRHKAYRDLADTSGILLVGEERTYELLERMIGAASSPFRTRRIHIGMDEAHTLGRGKYLDRFGYRRNFDIFNEHLSRVLKICHDFDLEPMIWSDMYFRMGSKTGDYYDRDSAIPREVVGGIPEGVKLVYWDYYHRDEEFYRDWIRRHRELGGTPMVASGIWTWKKLWYDDSITSATVTPCIAACKEEGVEEIFFTLWGNDGAECEADSALAGLTWAAELVYGGAASEEVLPAKFSAICGGDYAGHISASNIEYPPGMERGSGIAIGFLWDDPLLGIYCRRIEADGQITLDAVAEHYETLSEKLSQVPRGWDAGNMDHVTLIAHVLAEKTLLRKNLVTAYANKDRDALTSIARKEIPQLQESLRKLWASHREVWLSHNKAFGLEVLTVRYGGLILRLSDVATRIAEYLAGKRKVIDELEEEAEALPPVSGYRNLATSSTIL